MTSTREYSNQPIEARIRRHYQYRLAEPGPVSTSHRVGWVLATAAACAAVFFIASSNRTSPQAIATADLPTTTTATASTTPSSVGPVDPEEMFRSDGTIDETKVPDLIPVAGPNGALVGYITKETFLASYLGEPSTQPDEREAVVDIDGNLVGYMIPEYGYIRLDDYQSGSFRESPPKYPVTTATADPGD